MACSVLLALPTSRRFSVVANVLVLPKLGSLDSAHKLGNPSGDSPANSRNEVIWIQSVDPELAVPRTVIVFPNMIRQMPLGTTNPESVVLPNASPRGHLYLHDHVIGRTTLSGFVVPRG